MPDNQSPAPLLRLASNVILKSLRKAVIKIDNEFDKDYNNIIENNAHENNFKKKSKAKRENHDKKEKERSRTLIPSSSKLSQDQSLLSLRTRTSSTLPYELLLTGGLLGTENESKSKISGHSSITGISSSCSIHSSSNIHQAASIKVTLSIMKVKKYLRSHLSPEVQQILLSQGLTYAVMSQTIPLIRFLIVKETDHLDLCGTNFWTIKNTEPTSAPIPVHKPHKVKTNEKLKFRDYLSTLNAPNEFDWYAADRLGRPVSMNDALEFFSIIRSSQCGSELKSLMINGRRGNYFPSNRDSMAIIEDACNEFRSLTKLFIRGMADDNLLKIIGKTVLTLKILDVSCSKFVTDEGIRNLFYENVVFTPILYTIPTYVQNSVKTMNPIIHSLELFDFSYTSITSSTITLISLLPHSFMFRRLMVPSIEAAFGHVLFIRHQVVFSASIKHQDSNFSTEIRKQIGKSGQTQFSKCVNKLFWKNSYLTLTVLEEPTLIPNYKSRKENSSTIFMGIITSTDTDKLVQGFVKFYNENLIFLYNISPVSITTLGEACPRLEFMQTILTGRWSKKNNCPLFPKLTTLNIFAEPSTISSILEKCPRLVKVQFRVIWKSIKDDDIVSSIEKSPSRHTLEEFWIAPGSYKKRTKTPEDKDNPNVDPSHLKIIPTATTVVNTNDNESKEDIQKQINKLNAKAVVHAADTEFGKNLIGYGDGESEIEDNCKLSMSCARKLVDLCSKLKRLGDLTWWSLATPQELAQFCQYIKSVNSSLVIIFDDILLPDFEIIHS